MFLVALIGLAMGGEPPLGDWDAGAGFASMKASVRADVEDYVASLGPLKRPFARRALLKATAPCRTIEISDPGDGLAIGCDTKKVAVAPPNGHETSFQGDDGRTLGLTHDVHPDGTLVQTYTSSRGTRVNHFVLLDDGGLRVDVAITSGLLDEPLKYHLRYNP